MRAAIVSLLLIGCGGGEFSSEASSDALGGAGGASEPRPGKMGGNGGGEPTGGRGAMGGASSGGSEPTGGAAPTGGSTPTGGAPSTGGVDPTGCEPLAPNEVIETASGCFAGDWNVLYCTHCGGAVVNGVPREGHDLDTPGPFVIEVDQGCRLECFAAGDHCTWDGTNWEC